MWIPQALKSRVITDIGDWRRLRLPPYLTNVDRYNVQPTTDIPRLFVTFIRQATDSIYSGRVRFEYSLETRGIGRLQTIHSSSPENKLALSGVYS